jgi:hypothetical protein
MITASIIRAMMTHPLMMEAVIIFETSVNFYQTTRDNIPEDSHFHTRLDKLKPHRPGDGDSKPFRNVGSTLPDYSPQHSRRQSLSGVKNG